MGERTHNLLPLMESHTHTERGQITDKQQRTTNHIALPSRQVSSLISNGVLTSTLPPMALYVLTSIETLTLTDTAKMEPASKNQDK